MYEAVALLRSLAVEQYMKEIRGSVKSWWTTLKKWQKNEVYENLYLITDATPEYFGNLGYNKIKRSQAPEEIQKTSNSQRFVRRMQIL